jgi:hypothetical protein
MRTRVHIAAAGILLLSAASAQEVPEGPREILRRLLEAGLQRNDAHLLLAELIKKAPHRLSGSAGADTAVALTARMLARVGADSVWTEPCVVPRWERGSVERATIRGERGRRTPITVCALGGSVPTPPGGIRGRVVEVTSFADLARLGEKVRGKIVFYNRPMNPITLNTFDAYGGAVDQRSRGAAEAAKYGAAGVLVRSVTLALDDVPHTGSLAYVDTLPKIPAAAVSTHGANVLSSLLAKEPDAQVELTLDCRTLADAPSANVIGEIRGTTRPSEIVLVGGHLDAWDTGQGAHDDGSGCVQAIEVLRLIRGLGFAPERTIRAVMFMNEENGSRGGPAYASNPARGRERHVAAIESDRGGYVPRGFTVQSDSLTLRKVLRWKPLFDELGAGRIISGYSGVDVVQIVQAGAAGFGLDVADHRYFDVHHSANDTLGAVHPRELESGAVAMALLAYLIAQEGL